MTDLQSKAVFISPDNACLDYMGRMDMSDSTAVKMYYAGSSVTIRFKGTDIKAKIKNHRMFNIQEMGVVVDGKVTKVSCGDNDGQETVIDLADDLDDCQHEVIFYKRQDGSHYIEFMGFYINGDVLPSAPVSQRRIECYGDSVSAGAVVEAVANTGMCDPDDTQGVYDNSWYSYSMITARNLGARLHNIAQGGIAIFDDTGYFHCPNCIGMETVYNKAAYFPEAVYSDWDFSKYIPQIVLFAVGQNDPHREGRADNDINDAEFRAKWKARYKSILCDLRGKYPKASFILLLTVLGHSEDWDKAVDEITEELKSEGFGDVCHLMFKRTGKATPGHPRITEQYEMAEELTAYITSLGDSVWDK